MSMLVEIAEDESELKMTPMIDVTFLLLIFFLLTIRFRVLEGKLAAYLPRDVGMTHQQVLPVEKVEISIEVDSAGRKVFASGLEKGQPWAGSADRRFDFVERTLSYEIGPRVTKDLLQLEAWLQELHARNPEAPVTIDCGPGTVYGDIVPVLDAVVGADFEQITFVGEHAWK